jgi:hypothetical protein
MLLLVPLGYWCGQWFSVWLWCRYANVSPFLPASRLASLV